MWSCLRLFVASSLFCFGIPHIHATEERKPVAIEHPRLIASAFEDALTDHLSDQFSDRLTDLWKGWSWGSKPIDESEFWEEDMVEETTGRRQAAFALELNIGDTNRFMKVSQGPTEDSVRLTMHKLYRYSDGDFKKYRKKVPNFEEEQIAVGNFINAQVRRNVQDDALARAVDKFYRNLVSVSGGAEWAKDLQAELFAARMGISKEILDNNPEFESFVRANYLHKHIVLHGHPVEISENGEPMLHVEGDVLPWSQVQDLIEVDRKGRLTSHFYTYEGLVSGLPHTEMRPFKDVGTDKYNGLNVIEIMTVDSFPPHTWIRLISADGLMYSAGYWGATPLNDIVSAVKHLVPEEGRVLGPDLFEITARPKDLKGTAIEISEEQFDDVLEFVRDYQANSDVCYQILDFSGQNCAGFVQIISDRLDLDVKTSSWLLPFNNPYDVMSWQKKVDKRRRTLLRMLPEDASEEERNAIMYGLP